MIKTIRTRQEALHFGSAFGLGAYHIMVWAGNPGLSKTRTIKEVLKEGTTVYFSGEVSPYQLYKDVYTNLASRFVVIDDVESLVRDRQGSQLLKAFCQTEAIKTVGWHKATRELDREGIPREYQTSAKFCLLCNDEAAISRHLGPVIDRGVLVRFRLTAQEVHKMVGGWMETNDIDREVYDFIGAHLRLIKSPSSRIYETATQTKRLNPGIDWKEAVFETFGLDEDEVEVARLMSDQSLSSNNHRWQEFVRRGYGSRAKFYRLASNLGMIGGHSTAGCDDPGEPVVESGPTETVQTPSVPGGVVMEALGFGADGPTAPVPALTASQAGETQIGFVSPKKEASGVINASSVAARPKLIRRLAQIIQKGGSVTYGGEPLSQDRLLELFGQPAVGRARTDPGVEGAANVAPAA